MIILEDGYAKNVPINLRDDLEIILKNDLLS
jgi:hypothetical protein